jgi:hypothetical protein
MAPVREVGLAPSTASPIRFVIGRGVVLRGRVETVESTQWLWITRGAQADHDVALSNLKGGVRLAAR